MPEIDFVDWLNKELENRKIKPADLARLARIDNGIISRIRSRERFPTPETLDAIARGLKIPPETVYRAAGLLPEEPNQDELTERLSHLVRQLSDQDKEELIQLARLEAKRGQGSPEYTLEEIISLGDELADRLLSESHRDRQQMLRSFVREIRARRLGSRGTEIKGKIVLYPPGAKEGEITVDLV